MGGGVIDGSGLPTQILRQVVADTHTALGVSPAPFPPPIFGGVINAPGSVPGG